MIKYAPFIVVIVSGDLCNLWKKHAAVRAYWRRKQIKG